MNQSDIRMGWPAALNCIPLETRKAHVTPPRQRIAACFVEGDSTDQDITKFYGAAQASSAAEVGTTRPSPDAAPPSTTDKPQGVWVKTSERKPQTPGDYRARRVWQVGVDNLVRHWYGDDGWSFDWRVGEHDGDRARVAVEQGSIEWFDTTPSKQEDDGWLEWNPKAGVTTMPRGAVEARFRNGEVIPANSVGTWGSFHKAGHEVIAYRIVKDQA